MGRPRDRIWRYVLVAAAVYFVIRGPARFFNEGGDFLTLFASSRSWLHGQNPYSAESLMASAVAAGAPVPDGQFSSTPAIYLPTALLLYSPLAALPWNVANGIWFGISLGAFWWACVRAGRLAGGLTAPLAAFFLAFAPVHTAFARGQPSLLTCALIIAGLTVERPPFAGLLLGLAMCIKPQLAIGFVLLPALWRQGAKVLWAFATASLITICAVLPMKMESLRLMVASLAAVNPVTGIVQGVGTDQLGFQLLNIDTLIPQTLYSGGLVAAIGIVIVAVTGMAVWRSSDRRISLAIVASASLLIGYRRFYDAEILWLGVPAVLALADSRIFPVLAGAYALFLIPGQTIAQRLFETSPDTPWAAILLRHEAIACVAIWVMFLVAARRQGFS